MDEFNHDERVLLSLDVHPSDYADIVCASSRFGMSVRDFALLGLHMYVLDILGGSLRNPIPNNAATAFDSGPVRDLPPDVPVDLSEWYIPPTQRAPEWR